MTNKLQIIIKSWNAIEYTKLLYASLLSNSTYDNEIVITDDNSSIETIAALKNLSKAKLILHAKKLGPGGVIRDAFEKSKNKYVVIMDNDNVVMQGWDKLLLENMTSGVAMVTPIRYSHRTSHPILKNMTSRRVWENIRQEHSQASLGQQLEKFFGKYSIEEFCQKIIEKNNLRAEEVKCPPGFISTSCVLVNREIIEKCGGVADPCFTDYGGEDVDLCWRVGKAGYKVLRAANVYVHHFEHSSMMQNKINVFEKLKKSNEILYKKWEKVIFYFEKKLISELGRKKVEKNYPFIKIFHEIKSGKEVAF